MNNKPITLQEKYNLTRQWMSDNRYFGNEISFFKKLLESNVVSPGGNRSVKIEHLRGKLRVLDANRELMCAYLQNYIENLELVFRNILPEEGLEINEKWEVLKSRVTKFVSDYHSYKDELFTAAEETMRAVAQPV
ncbi:hypothetical protein FW774_16340 [Pedobacter sp. BS3]|uniref:hypothetical protein n=1 Tax=Pedobacter sp. BS3 TaxID=2567937 RepID=UPI0011EF8638|nr:hypothetical protein [Pedobacter sp. BS3]TZF82253.1 hypothetical protein FW774_16340 [Pedobacter sp. BS3]